MPYWDRITPALYAIAKKVAPIIIKERWDNLVVPILREENRIYERAFDTFAFVRGLKHNEASALEIFIVIMKYDGINFEQDVIPNFLLDIYWDMAEDESYWYPDNYATTGGRIPYDQAIQKWVTTNQHRIRSCEENLKQWLNEN